MNIQQTEKIAKQFLAHTLPIEQWTHEAHLIVGLWHLLQFNPEECLNRLRSEIKSFNTSIGVTNTDTSGYHETVTHFYIKMIAHFLSQQDTSRPIDDLAQDMLAVIGCKGIYMEYYSKDRLISDKGRHNFIEPDLKPLPESKASNKKLKTEAQTARSV
mgnify:CR=1 FL=1